jgi:hypothetical protein
MKFKHLLAAAGFALGALASNSSMAIPIAGLVNTGVSSIAGGTDANYALTKTSGSGPLGAMSNKEWSGIGFPAGYWLPNSTGPSQWLTTQTFANGDYDNSTSPDPSVNGVYHFLLSFTIAQTYIGGSASFNGRWATDNSGVIRLNGVVINNPSAGYGSWATFSSAGGPFHVGVNTLDFEVTNLAQGSGNPLGLRVEFLDSSLAVRTQGEGNIGDVPEPATLALLGLGLAGLGFARRRKQIGA